MRRVFFALTAALASTVAGAQVVGTPTDADINAAYSFCNRPENRVPLGTVGNRPVNAGGYARAGCKEIEVEYTKRDLAKKAQDKAAEDHLNEVLKRLPK